MDGILSRKARLLRTLVSSSAPLVMASSIGAEAQTATPSALPPTPEAVSTIDRNGIDRSSGTVGDYHFESVSIGNKYAGIDVLP